jgi:hypothetical protein
MTEFPPPPGDGTPPELPPASAWVVPGQPPDGAPSPIASQRVDGLGVASLVLGVIGVLLVPAFGAGLFIGIPAVIMGHVARWRIRRSGRIGAGGAALAALIVGYAAIAGSVLVWVVIGVTCYQAHGGGC